MSAFTDQIGRGWKRALMMILSLLLGLLCATAFAHESTFEGHPAVVKQVDFNDSHVLLLNNVDSRSPLAKGLTEREIKATPIYKSRDKDDYRSKFDRN